MKINNVIGASLLLAISLNASAASTADLGVTGLITPSACDPTISGNGVFDYGDVSADRFKGVERVNLGSKALNFNIACAVPTLLGLSGIGENNDSASSAPNTSYDSFGFAGPVSKPYLGGLGWTTDGKRVGAFAPVIEARKVTDKGVSVTAISSDNNGPWRVTGVGNISTGGARIISFAVPGTLTPVAVSDVSTRLAVSTYINATGADADGLTFDDVIDFEGRLAIEVVYL